jgi:hypothetical protein
MSDSDDFEDEALDTSAQTVRLQMYVFDLLEYPIQFK